MISHHLSSALYFPSFPSHPSLSQQTETSPSLTVCGTATAPPALTPLSTLNGPDIPKAIITAVSAQVCV